MSKSKGESYQYRKGADSRDGFLRYDVLVRVAKGAWPRAGRASINVARKSVWFMLAKEGICTNTSYRRNPSLLSAPFRYW